MEAISLEDIRIVSHTKPLLHWINPTCYNFNKVKLKMRLTNYQLSAFLVTLFCEAEVLTTWKQTLEHTTLKSSRCLMLWLISVSNEELFDFLKKNKTYLLLLKRDGPFVVNHHT